MPIPSLQAESVSENPETAWNDSRRLYAMAVDDAAQAGDTDAELNHYGPAQNSAMVAMLETPAPDLAALAHKLETYISQDCSELISEYRDPILSAMLADVRNLGGLA